MRSRRARDCDNEERPRRAKSEAKGFKPKQAELLKKREASDTTESGTRGKDAVLAVLNAREGRPGRAKERAGGAGPEKA